jgi:hypothetical protein
MTSYGDNSKTALVLKGVLEHPNMAKYAKAVGIIPAKEQEVALFNYRQQQQAFNLVSATGNPRGHPNDDNINFMRSVAISVTPNGDSADVPSKNKRIVTFGHETSRSTQYRLLDRATKRRTL